MLARPLRCARALVPALARTRLTTTMAVPGSDDDVFATYAIKVFTADMRGAGTRAKVSATLIGDRGTSARLVLSNQEQIERDSVQEFVVSVDSEIGNIKRLRIGHDESNLGEASPHSHHAAASPPPATPAHCAHPA